MLPGMYEGNIGPFLGKSGNMGPFFFFFKGSYVPLAGNIGPGEHRDDSLGSTILHATVLFPSVAAHEKAQMRT